MKEMAARAEGERGLRRPGAVAESWPSDRRAPIPAGHLGRDSAPVPNSQFKVFLTRVATMVPKGAAVEAGWKIAQRGTAPRPEQSTPLFVEMALPGTRFDRRLVGECLPESPEIARLMHWRSRHGQSEIPAAANGFARHLLGIQKRYAEVLKLARVAESVAELERELAAAESQNACLVNLGWGGGLLSKSRYRIPPTRNIESIVRVLPFYERAIRAGMPFPKTRKIVFLDSEPGTVPAGPGWKSPEYRNWEVSDII